MVTKQILNKQITNKTAVLIFFISIEKKTNLIVNRSPIIVSLGSKPISSTSNLPKT